MSYATRGKGLAGIAIPVVQFVLSPWVPSWRSCIANMPSMLLALVGGSTRRNIVHFVACPLTSTVAKESQKVPLPRKRQAKQKQYPSPHRVVQVRGAAMVQRVSLQYPVSLPGDASQQTRVFAHEHLPAVCGPPRMPAIRARHPPGVSLAQPQHHRHLELDAATRRASCEEYTRPQSLCYSFAVLRLSCTGCSLTCSMPLQMSHTE